MSAAPPVARDLRTFVELLRREGELVDVETEVSADLEAAEVHRRVAAANGPALLFHRVEGADFPLVTNLFGSKRRVDLAFGRRAHEIVEELARLPEELLPPSLRKLWGKIPLARSLARVGTKRRRSAPVLEVVDSPARLSRLPAIKSWKRDGGRFVTLPLVYTEHPETGVHNLGMYRIQLYSEQECGVHIQIHRGGGFHLARAEELGHPLPVNVHVGGPPALILGAICPLPENVPELLFASLVLGEKLGLSRNPAGPLPVVSDAEFVLVGQIEPGARRPEGPFGDHYGYYSEVHDFPWMRCEAVLRRRDAIFPATVVGKPKQEDFYIGDHLQDLLSPLFPLVMPSVKELWSYGETGYHSLSAAIVHERYRREAMVSAFRILGEGQLSLTKFLMLTDGAVDLRDFRAVLTHVLERADFARDLFVIGNLSMDTLDYAGPRLNEGSKGVLLGLGDAIRELPTDFRGTPSARIRKAIPFCPGCLVIEGAAHEEDPSAGRELVRENWLEGWPLVVLTDDAERATRSATNFLWSTFTRFDPSADVHAASVELTGSHPSFHAPVLIDARRKPGYPEELFCDEETRSLVDRRWKEYFPAGKVEMGDSDRGHLD